MSFFRIHISLLLIFLSGYLYSSPREIRFRKINMNSGLSHNSALCLMQDHNGLIWIGTRDGLNRYDGSNFKIYKHIFNDSLSISNNQITCVAETRENEIWVGTANGLNRMNRDMQSFTRFRLAKDTVGLNANYVWSILESADKKLWIGCTSGLYIMNASRRKLNHIFIKTSPADNANTIISLFQDSSNKIWVGTRNGLYHYTNGRFNRIFLDKGIERNETRFEIRDIREDKNGLIWVGTENHGLFSLNPKTEPIVVTSKINTNNSRLISNTIRKIFFYDDDNIWLGTLEGLINYNLSGRQFTNYSYSANDPFGISNNSIRDIIRDDLGGIWVASYAGGVNYYHPENNMFSRHFKFNGQGKSVESNVVSVLLEDEQDHLWVGTEGGGLFCFDKNSNQLIASYNPLNSKIVSNNIKSLALGNNGKLWIGTFHGLSCLDRNTNKFRNYYNEQGNENSLNNNQVHALIFENEKRIWIGTNGGGVQLFNSVTDSFQNVADLENENINVLFADSENRVWAGSQQGIFCIDKASGKLLDLNPVIREKSNFIHYVTFINEDSSKNIWIGTQGNGLFLIKNKHTYWFNTSNGLDDNTVNALLEGEKDQYWITSNRGLSKMSYSGLAQGNLQINLKTFTEREGVQGGLFYPRSALKRRSGSLLFGGTNGYNEFKPQDINDYDFSPRIVLSQLRLKYKLSTPKESDSPLKKPLNETQHLILSYNQRDFTISFIGLNYRSPENTFYRYKVRGLDNDWIDLGTQRIINFTYFPTGSYELLLKASTDPDKWSPNYKSLEITVLPPWWKTGWAFVGYALLLSLLLFTFFWYSQRWANLKNDLAMEHFQLEKEKELHQLKLKFFTDVSHELRTPLTLILTPLERIVMHPGITNRVRNQLLNIQRNGLRMMQLINQILDLRKLETGHQKLKVARGNISRFLKETSLGFKEMADSKGIDFEFTCDNDNLEIWYDRDKMEIILYNLLSNALKNTPKGGKVKLVLSVESANTIEILPETEKYTGKYARITVTNYGKGIPQEKLEAIFHRFYTLKDHSDNHTYSSGVGLELTKRLVELHHGLIAIKSRVATEQKEGETIFTVWLPLGNKHFKPDEIFTDFKDSEDLSLYTREFQSRELAYDSYDETDDEEVSGRPGEKQQLLIVEDNTEVREFIKSLFKQNYVVAEAGDGKTGLKKALQNIPDLIISDIMMPEMDGIELCRKIKTDIRTSHIPVILLTARTAVTFKYEGLETGADEYITKPFSAQYLLIRVKNLIKQRDLLKTHFQHEAIIDPGTITLTSVDEKLLKKAVDYITDNISDPSINVNKLSEHVGLSRVHFYRKIKALTNQTAVEFIRNVKLKRAAALLSQKKLSVKEIQNMVGFEDADYFRDCFKKQYGVPPSEYAAKKEYN